MLCSSDDVLNQILSEVRELKTCMSSRLTSLELSVSVLVKTCSKISFKLETLSKSNNVENKESPKLNSCCKIVTPTSIKRTHSKVFEAKENDVNLECLEREDFKPPPMCDAEDETSEKVEPEEKDNCHSGQLKLIPLSSKEDYPNGSWLGDPDCHSRRVRCHISQEKLLHINATCFSPEKMALILLDSLFTKEELSISNISGRSRWGKKQLKPLFIFGIKCHLQHRFFISEKDWHRICQNIDAKCRFAWKRRFRMANKNAKSKIKIRTFTNKEKAASTSSTEDINFDYDNLSHTSIDFNSCVKVISQNPCELRIVNATPDQLAHLQGSGGIILTQEMIPEASEDKAIMMSNQDGLSMDGVVMNDEAALGSHLTISPNGDTTLEVSMEEETPSPLTNSSTAVKEEASTSCQIHSMTLKEFQLPAVDHAILERDSEVDD